ncbi:DUF4439 domain-containing protein [Isoptericola sp. NEAU-Y5]|uniref:DUF4439 domain-containing protein n=1 Tax=Isoptericola luteus TaxID=2879484 RepID=A0ABS7ZHD3_9MICO|nr:DUF4439 domain-containing protein [Isoptericola sp. NEAU-Y5]MCA5893225.1 DUF4439 domain-containing protein [Isoptericola sp. NEAU-Y5]
MEPPRSPAPADRPDARRRLSVLAAAVLVGGLVAGCGVRLETPPAAEPVPDALEIVRRTAVSDALLVAERADAALENVPARRERLVSELTRIAADSRTQAAGLGGEYDSGLGSDDPSVSPEGSAAGGAEDGSGDVPDVVSALVDAAARSRTAAGSTADGPLARLLASVGAAQTVSATRLADLADTTGPATPDVEIPAADRGAPDDDAEPSDAPSAEQTSASDGEASPAVPEGLTARDLSTLVESEDATGYAMRLRAAIADGRRRDRLLERVASHADRADGWAAVAGTAGTDQDPRRAAYQVPRVAEQDDKSLVLMLEDDLTVDYATLVATTAPGTRTVLVDLLVDGALALDDWGAEPAPFPGLPEQDADGA